MLAELLYLIFKEGLRVEGAPLPYQLCQESMIQTMGEFGFEHELDGGTLRVFDENGLIIVLHWSEKGFEVEADEFTIPVAKVIHAAYAMVMKLKEFFEEDPDLVRMVTESVKVAQDERRQDTEEESDTIEIESESESDSDEWI